ncbi:hypothetical protein [Marinovum algicola]|uniref:hypothetical protein n=1 Tax=Marinovum algicola TaxID=42444 RepID=UPI003529EBB2
MAYNSVFTASGNIWAQPAAENVAGELKIQNVGAYSMMVYATDGAAPAGGPETVGYTSLAPGQGLQGTLAELFPGVASPTRLWLYGSNGISASVQYL